MIVKLKFCNGCHTDKRIWKNYQGERFCKTCWMRLNPTVIKPVSDKQAVRNREYSVVRKEHLAENPFCKAKLPGCTGIATQIHHNRGRIGDDLTDRSTFVSICANCHRIVESESENAKLFNLST